MTVGDESTNETAPPPNHDARALLAAMYDELRALARARMRHEQPGVTLEATALVHEAWLRLGGETGGPWESPAQFFAAAAEAMRRILVDESRRRRSQKRGGEADRIDVQDLQPAAAATDDRLLAVHEALDRLAASDPLAAELVKLRFFAGLNAAEAAAALELPVRSAHDVWTFARAWLRRELGE